MYIVANINISTESKNRFELQPTLITIYVPLCRRKKLYSYIPVPTSNYDDYLIHGWTCSKLWVAIWTRSLNFVVHQLPSLFQYYKRYREHWEKEMSNFCNCCSDVSCSTVSPHLLVSSAPTGRSVLRRQEKLAVTRRWTRSRVSLLDLAVTLHDAAWVYECYCINFTSRFLGGHCSLMSVHQT